MRAPKRMSPTPTIVAKGGIGIKRKATPTSIIQEEALIIQDAVFNRTVQRLSIDVLC
jgi:hypothetical protein